MAYGGGGGFDDIERELAEQIERELLSSGLLHRGERYLGLIFLHF